MMDISKEELELEALLMEIDRVVPEFADRGTQCNLLQSVECGRMCGGCGAVCQEGALNTVVGGDVKHCSGVEGV